MQMEIPSCTCVLFGYKDQIIMLISSLEILKEEILSTRYKIQDTKTLFLIRKTSHKITAVKPNIFYIIHDT